MEITDNIIAEVLEKTLEEVTEIKTDNPDAYEVIRYGVMCHKLSLTEEDLEEYANQRDKEVEIHS